MSAKPRVRLPAPLLGFVLLAAVGTMFLAMSNDTDHRPPTAEPERAVPADEPLAALLAVRGTEAAGKEGARTKRGAKPAKRDEAAPATTAAPAGRLLLFTAEWFRLSAMGELPEAPGSVLDELDSSALTPLVFSRTYVVGRPGAYGIRGDFGTTGSYSWHGLATLTHAERASTEAEEDTKEPAKAAIRGTIIDTEGEPIQGAEVILYSSFYVRQAYYDHRVRQIGRVLSDAEGVFEVSPLDLDTVHFGGNGEVLMTPSDYDKTERMIVLDACPTAITDERGAYELTDFAAGDHELSVHVNIDCVRRERMRLDGERTWSPVCLREARCVAAWLMRPAIRWPRLWCPAAATGPRRTRTARFGSTTSIRGRW